MIIRSVAVLGAGVMGSQIAAHFANAGVPSLLLDVTADAAAQGLKRARGLKPDPFFLPDGWTLVSTGSFDDGMPRLGQADWIVECVVEQLDAKRALLERVDKARRAGSVVSSNTSGLPIGSLAEGRSDDFRRHWLGTHFFNPPRYLRLLEIIPTPDTDPSVVRAVTEFAEARLGKGVVVAKDAPTFIGNHLALYGMARILEKVSSGEYTIEEVDAITGEAIGRPKSATFRTLDLAGIDILGHVIRNIGATLPPFVDAMIRKGLTGEKTGAGFYKRIKRPDGESEILTIDPSTLEYRQRQSPKLPSLEATRNVADTGERIRTLLNGQ